MNDEPERNSDELAFDIETEIEIPPLFYSEETRQPFERCIDCNAELLPPNGPDAGESYYHVQKVIVRNEAVFEIAMCMECQETLRSEFSEETRQAMVAYLRERVSMSPLSLRASFEESIASCLVCERSRSECHRYSLSGMFAGASLLLGPGPFMFCDDCEIEISELVSQKTRDAWDRFVDEHFDAPPGIEVDDWDRTPVLI